MSEESITINWEKFKKLVREHGYSFESLGKATGLGRRNIENIKNHDPGYSKMVKIADALDVSLDEFR
ncbi:TPA: helix-turn-helix transcriptional regulator [Streptococcus agalactiae]|nr:helix-turn-helix transcriptional regulator [Streptococcus agalactiae]OTG53452.1 transcriptional regulator [Streptococcus agalactiae]HEO6665831.1 helix-turn-helix transcriptional regulator [Streptococcus agalactiae]HEO6677798.1 helix-turn-helix transcriptional regulator [Streptococcus agalactiae]HEO6683665.1 helix-turn-helix transcriptional regulator [Streptococcus agalactiae]HEO6756337.1 helix-turn-helix transcriptional regulator [Streptococcus agalactiae]